MWIQTHDGIKLDAMWIPSPEQAKATVIYINPNAVIYENWAMEHSMIDFYQGLNFNILLWNYRGYGRSEGSPTPSNIIEDGRSVLNHLLASPFIDETSEKIVIHGQSLGGGVTANIKSDEVKAILCD
jgi:fermentation-respiration switch protein FrsA (DUF1100 family)